jgi:hypothetical protein
MDKAKTTPTESTKKNTNTGTGTSKMPGSPKSKDHKAMHPEREIPASEPAERAAIFPATHIDDDPESYRLT